MPQLDLEIRIQGLEDDLRKSNDLIAKLKDQIQGVDSAGRSAGAGLRDAFKATSGTIQVASGIKQTADAFGSLNNAAGLFSSSRLLLEIGKTADDFRDLRSSVGGTGGVLSSLGLIIKAHPLLTLASVIGAIASAMSLFGGETKKAGQNLEDAGKKAQGFQSDIAGIASARATGGDLRKAYRSYLDKRLISQFDQIPFGEPYRLGGGEIIPGEQYLGLRAADRLAPGIHNRILQDRDAFTNPLPTGLIGSTAQERRKYDQDYLITRREFDDYISEQLRRSDTAPGINANQLGPIAFGQQSVYPNAPGGGTEVRTFGLNYPGGPGILPRDRNYVEIGAADAAAVNVDHTIVMSERIKENMERAAEYSGQIGSNFGNALADVALHVTSLRSALANLFAQSARQGFSLGVGGIFSGIGSAVAGKTQTQKSQEYGPPAPPTVYTGEG